MFPHWLLFTMRNTSSGIFPSLIFPQTETRKEEDDVFIYSVERKISTPVPPVRYYLSTTAL